MNHLKSVLFYFRCSDGFMGQRCEFKDLDGTYVCKFCPLIPLILMLIVPFPQLLVSG